MMKDKSVMWDYIGQEQGVLSGLLNSNRQMQSVWSLTDVDAIYIVAHGSSYNAAIVCADFMARYTGTRVYAYTPANFLYNCAAVMREAPERTLIAAISQTGTSRGVLEAVQKGKKDGFSVLGITNVLDSPLAQISERVLHLGCGEEDSNAKTKGYSATLLLLVLFSVHLGLARGVIAPEDLAQVYNELEKAIGELPAVTARVGSWCEQHCFGSEMQNVYVLGYGMNFGSAMEGQLKLMETMCIPTMFNDIEEFSHGMHRAIDQSSSVILMDTGGSLSDLTRKTFDYLKTKTEKVVLLNASGTPLKDAAEVSLPCFPRTESILIITTALQVLSVFAPEQNGQDPNRDANNDYTRVVQTRI